MGVRSRLDQARAVKRMVDTVLDSMDLSDTARRDIQIMLATSLRPPPRVRTSASAPPSWLDAAADEIDPDRPNGFTDPESWRKYVELITPVLDEAAEALAKYHTENRKIRTRLRRAYRALLGRP